MTAPAYWTRERILSAIHAWTEQHGEPPRAQEWQRGTPDFPARTTVCAMFGTWNTAISEAGYETRDCKGWTPWDKDKIAAAFLDFLVRERRWPTSRDCMWRGRKPGMPDWRTVYFHFGSWNAAKTYAGWDPDAKTRISRQEGLCSGCGCDYGAKTIGCRACMNRHWNYKRRQDKEFVKRETARRTARARRSRLKIAPDLPAAARAASPLTVRGSGDGGIRGDHLKEAA